MTSLARWCYTHRRRVLLLWILALIVLNVASQSAGDGYADSFKLPGTESTKALNLLQDSFSRQSGDSDTVVWHVQDGSVRDAAVQDRMTRTLREIAGQRHVDGVDSPYTKAGAAQISRDGRTAYATVHYDGEANDVGKAAYEKLIDTAGA